MSMLLLLLLLLLLSFSIKYGLYIYKNYWKLTAVY